MGRQKHRRITILAIAGALAIARLSRDGRMRTAELRSSGREDAGTTPDAALHQLTTSWERHGLTRGTARIWGK